ncbi:MAG: hypothetical protein ACRD6X_18815 [Pyrinomonadaceae bacterium]
MLLSTRKISSLNWKELAANRLVMFHSRFRFLLLSIHVTVFGIAAAMSLQAQTTGCKPAPEGRAEAEIKMISQFVNEIVNESFPELCGQDFKIGLFKSDSVFFKTRFSFSRLLTFRKIGVVMDVNPDVFQSGPSDAAIKAILAHELAHADFYRRNGGFKAFRMIGLLGGKSLAKFERRADLTAIEKGYGLGLKEFREWLYKNIPSNNINEKKRNYFTPEEIDLLITANKDVPGILKNLRKNIPLSLTETIAAVNKFKTGYR